MTGHSATRRQTLAAAGATLVALAGCSDDGSDGLGQPTDGGDDGNGLFEQEATTDSDQSGQQVTNRLNVVSATGQVTPDETVSEVTVTVKKAPGAANIDLRGVTVSWVESGGTYKVVHDSVGSDQTDAEGRFAVSVLADDDDSSPVLNDPGDRFSLVFDLGSSASSTADPGATFADALTEGQIVTIQLTARSGGTTNARLVVPQSLSGAEAVNL